MGLTINPLSLKIIIPIQTDPIYFAIIGIIKAACRLQEVSRGFFFEASYYKSDPTKGPLELYDMPTFGANSELSMP